jgi:hypothetical protein
MPDASSAGVPPPRRAAAAVAALAPPPAVVAATPPPPAEPTRTAPPAVTRPAAPPAFWIQVGAFRSATTAGRVAAHVDGEILVVAPRGPTGRRVEPVLRVRVGPFPDRAHAAARLRAIRSLGYRPFIAVGD